VTKILQIIPAVDWYARLWKEENKREYPTGYLQLGASRELAEELQNSYRRALVCWALYEKDDGTTYIDGVIAEGGTMQHSVGNMIYFIRFEHRPERSPAMNAEWPVKPTMFASWNIKIDTER
jgi:hypothetical protein